MKPQGNLWEIDRKRGRAIGWGTKEISTKSVDDVFTRNDERVLEMRVTKEAVLLSKAGFQRSHSPQAGGEAQGEGGGLGPLLVASEGPVNQKPRPDRTGPNGA